MPILQNNEIILKAATEKIRISYKGKLINIISDLLAETLRPEKQERSKMVDSERIIILESHDLRNYLGSW
jgi:hypothetical protein